MSGTALPLIDGVYSCTMSGTVRNPFNSMMLIFARVQIVYKKNEALAADGRMNANVLSNDCRQFGCALTAPRSVLSAHNRKQFTSHRVL